MKRLMFILAAILLALVATYPALADDIPACDTPEPTETVEPTATVTVQPTETPPAEQDTPTPTVEPTETPEATPTQEKERKHENTPTVAPTPTEQVVILLPETGDKESPNKSNPICALAGLLLVATLIVVLIYGVDKHSG